MSTINIEHVLEENKKISRAINDLGELLMREDSRLYNQIILSNFEFTKKLNQEEEKNFLRKLYNAIIDKLKELKFDQDNTF